MSTFVSWNKGSIYTYSLVGITQWCTDTVLHQQESLSFGDCWGHLCFMKQRFYYTYSLVGITQHWHSPTPAGIPVVWRQDTFVSLTTRDTYSLVGITQSWLTQSYTSRNPCRLETGHLCFINYYTYSLVGITQHWHRFPTPVTGIPVVWRQDTFVSFYYTYSLVGITHHWHSPTPAGIPVVWRQDTFVSLTITHTLWWASLNTDTVLHQQESLSFGDRTPLFH